MQLELLDFGDRTPGVGHFGRPRNLAWPVCAYRVTMPSPENSDDGLNPFERVVRDIIEASGISAAELIAEETCIPFDFVRGVILRLRDKGFIDENNQLVEKERPEEKTNDILGKVYCTAMIFRELVSGMILPYIHVLDYSSKLATKVSENNWLLPSSREKPEPISENDVRKAIKEMRRVSISYDSDIRPPAPGQIFISDAYEYYNLDCPVIMWEKDGDFRVLDPFPLAKGRYSSLLEKSLHKLIETNKNQAAWFNNWRNDLANTQEKQATQGAEPYDNEVCRKRYPELIEALKPDRHSHFRSQEKLYAALEWALFYSNMKYEYKNAVCALKLTPQQEQSNMLVSIAEKIALEIPAGYRFKILTEEELGSFLDGDAELNSMLAIALLLALNDKAHPLNTIAKEHPDFFHNIYRIKEIRGPLAHGKGTSNRLDAATPDEPFIRSVITLLLPDVRFSKEQAKINSTAIVIDTRFDAGTSLREYFGYGVFNNRIDNNVKDRLISAESFWLACKNGDNVWSFAMDICGAMQGEFSCKLSHLPSVHLPETEYITSADEKSQAAGLGSLPEELSTVKPYNITNALSGNDKTTLGGIVIAFILKSDDETLSKIAEQETGFLNGIANALKVRGHNKSISLTKSEIGHLRKAAYSVINILMEV